MKITKLEITPEQAEYFRDLRRNDLISSGAWAQHLHPSPSEYVRRASFYIETLEDFISQEEQRELDALQAAHADLSEEYPYWWDEIFRENLRATFLSAACSYVELALSELCEDAALVANEDPWERPKRSFVASCRTYLSSLGFQAPNARVWGELQVLYSVRNSLLHNGGRLWDSSKKEQRSIRGLISRSIGLTETHDQLELTAEFPSHVLSVVSSFFEPLNGEFSDLCSRAV